MCGVMCFVSSSSSTVIVSIFLPDYYGGEERLNSTALMTAT